MDFNYFTVSQYIIFSIATITIPIFIFRLLRIFPTYVKTGSIGDDDNAIVFTRNLFGKRATSENRRKMLYNFVTETHPTAIIMDILTVVLFGAVLFIFWVVIPYMFVIWFILWSIIKFAQYSRKKYVRKEEFVGKLDGTHKDPDPSRSLDLDPDCRNGGS